jgi:hypothetical protein
MEDDMDDEGNVPIAPSRTALLWWVASAVAAGTLIFVIAILPVEFNIDPTGIGRLVGLDRLAGPAQVEVAATVPGGGEPTYFSDVPFRTDTVDIPLQRSGTLFEDELEWKVRMKQGATIVYSWTVPDLPLPDEFYFSFHGQSEPGPGEGNPQVMVTTFREEVGSAQSGSLVAPYDGLWGWYLQNQTDRPVVVKMRIAGYYEIATREEIAAAAAAVPPPAPEPPVFQ